ncbi:hypothetical protein M438DRAFT_405636 [Aureobasidium pullulans EXF-150]|uniref:Pathogen-related protein n=2 Tax=Aureobasidium pullulans TaxID=5580 RepID=A0A074XG52_AURPU|nr:uncharacterized protein M438DRAFT_405636 [Aureobasidium pullulans EXF-150]KEQ84408.1 hypothetical protein M438DRAFT_405636 [Aureobasidium pullulans EXF-150]THW45821.1 hypothetical protein D6D22_03355 [Aureobasidium pullulans]THX28859.1 hypothetical protein D6D12_04581 [Aureobasidium pullulans]THX37913.1 hypothetical protein D6D11_09121 [Aureobasidium pullulans]
MAAADVQQPVQAEPAPSIPDYLADPDAVLKDNESKWRYGRAPDYSKTRKVYSETKQMNHTAGSLESMVENLVKNWEVEASFKPQLSDWRTVDHSKYTFAINGGPPQTAEHMLKVGTYNAIIAPNEYYSPNYSDFASSHKTFKRMMPTFAWEVLEVYSGPPKVAFKWRHWGTMKNDYVGFNDKGEKVTAKAHGGAIDITGITVATVDDAVRLQEVNTYFDPIEMFRQIAPNGIVNKQVVDKRIDPSAALDADIPSQDGVELAHKHSSVHANESSPTDTATSQNKTHGPSSSETCPVSGASMSAALSAGCPVMSAMQSSSTTSPTNSSPGSDWVKVPTNEEGTPRSAYSSSVTGDVEHRMSADNKIDYNKEADAHDEVDEHLESSAETVHPHPHTMEHAVKPVIGDAVVAGPQSEETKLAHREMSSVTKDEEPLLMNRE